MKYLYVIFIFFMSAHVVLAQDMLPQDFKVEKLQLNLSLNPDSRTISGTATYTVNPFHNEATNFILFQRELSINSVTMNGNNTEFFISDDTLRISVDPSLTSRIIEISYNTVEGNGLIETHNGVFMTSLQPGMLKNWFPALDNPWFSHQYELSLTVPAGYEVVTSGNFVNQTNNPDGTLTQNWRSQIPIPSNHIGFVTGDFTFEEALSGTKTARVYTTSDTQESVNRNQLLRFVASSIGNIQRDLRYEFPFDGLSIVILDDHYWQTIPFSAGYGLVFTNGGGLESQIASVVDAQWFGVLQRAAAVNLPETSFLLSLTAGESNNRSFAIPQSEFLPVTQLEKYPAFDSQYRGAWHKWFQEKPAIFREAIYSKRQDIIRTGNQVLVWEEFVKDLYQKTGQVLTYPQLTINETTETETVDSVVIVDLAIDYIASENRINLVVNPNGRVDSDSINIPLFIEYRNSSENRTLSVFRTGGEFSLSVSSRSVNIKVDYQNISPNIQFVEIKNMDMWLHQLRSDESPEMRTEAAMNLSRFRDEPDLQLALSDFLRREQSSEVRAAIIRSTSDLIGAASGTEQMFISMMASAGDEELVAIIDALMNYTGNQDAIGAVQNVALQSPNVDAAISAVTAYRLIGGNENFLDLAVDILIGNRPQQVKAAVIRELFRMGDMVIAVDTTLEIIEGQYPYLLRKAGLEMLVSYELRDSIDEVFPTLANDRDPRIRYFILQNADKMTPRLMNDLLESRYFSETDERVRTLFDLF